MVAILQLRGLHGLEKLMCNRIRLMVVPSLQTVDVQSDNDVAVIRIPDTIDAVRLRSEIEGFVDSDQFECATRLWSDDSYMRHFGNDGEGIVISCTPVY